MKKPSCAGLAGELPALAPTVGLPIVVCAVSYGDASILLERLLSTLYQTTDTRLFTLRIGLNAASEASHALCARFKRQHRNIQITSSPTNIFKAAMMRRLFHQSKIDSKWTIWCDDDTHFVRRDWLHRLTLKIEQSPTTAMWGCIHSLWTGNERVLEWFRSAHWYRGRRFIRSRDPSDTISNEFVFPTGGFWAIRTELLYTLDWPDSRLIQGGDDVALGEALRQHRVAIGDFRYGVMINDALRRNATAPEHELPVI